MQEHSLSVGFYLYSFQTLDVLSCVCCSKISSPVSAFAEHPLIRQHPEKHRMTQLSLQRNPKLPLHILMFLNVRLFLTKCYSMHENYKSNLRLWWHLQRRWIFYLVSNEGTLCLVNLYSNGISPQSDPNEQNGLATWVFPLFAELEPRIWFPILCLFCKLHKRFNLWATVLSSVCLFFIRFLFLFYLSFKYLMGKSITKYVTTTTTLDFYLGSRVFKTALFFGQLYDSSKHFSFTLVQLSYLSW